MGQKPGTEQQSGSLTIGTVVDGRFVIERSAGRGGMATVHQAKDLVTGQTVALKLLRSSTLSGLEATRLLLESQLLAELHHPRIVSYICHGLTADSHPYLAMEWLDGEDLAQRLQRSPMRIDEALSLLEGVAEALSAAHSRGIIHRDIKPSNLFLRDKQAEKVTLLDFGVARNQERGLLLTRTGALVGTPGYMAPEQAKGVREIEPSADIFALGCILHECLTGAPPFVAMHFSALLALILYEEVPTVSSLRPDVPDALSELVAKMLRKEPRLRPANGTKLVAEIEKFRAATTSHSPSSTTTHRPVFRQMEEQLHGVVVASQRPPRILSFETLDYSEPDPGFVASQQELASLLCQVNAQVERLADETLVANFRIEATATEQLTEILGHILQVRDLWPSGLVVVTISPADANGRVPVGTQLEKVCQLFDAAHPAEWDTQPKDAALTGVFVDDGIAALLSSIFDLDRLHPRLFRVQSGHDESRPVPPSLFESKRLFGRERELGLLHGTLRNCQEESVARVVLMTGRGGLGKSRLLWEFVTQAQAQTPHLTVFSARADQRATTSLTPLLGSALRRLCGITPNDLGTEAAEKLRQRIQLRMSETEVAQCLPVLCALCSIAPSVLSMVRAEELATFDLGELSTAFLRFISAESAAVPILFAFDDLQSADAASVKIMDRVLAELADRALNVVGLADPSISIRFPKLWAQANTEILRLHPLSQQISEQLAHSLSNGRLSKEQTDKVVRIAQGHPQTLHELLLWELDPHKDRFPSGISTRIFVDSLLLPRDARRMVRAASAIGPVFWDESVRLILGEPRASDRLARALAVLAEQEWIVPQRSSRYPGCQEYRFRQVIVQECFAALIHPEERQIVTERMEEFYAQATSVVRQ